MGKVPLLLTLVSLAAAAAEARVVRFEIDQTRSFAGGKSFGDVGLFERLDGTVYFEVDPHDPVNAVIVNLDKAPRNVRGLVEFSARFFVIRPVDMSRGNQKILYAINNRGNNFELGVHTFPAASDGDARESGDGLLFRLGYTYVDVGWAGDIESTATRLGATFPIAAHPDGSPIVAPIRIEYMNTVYTASLRQEGYTLPLKSSTAFRPYETADTDTTNSSLSVRDTIEDARTPIMPDRWAFGRCPTGRASLEPTTTDICVFDGVDPTRIYDLVYPAKNPWVMGLAYAVTRDVGSFLRYETVDDTGNPNPLATDAGTVGVRRVYGLGASSTGMYLRDFLHLGFNEDETHRKVFDAVRILSSGTHRLFANVEFADPNPYSRQDQFRDFLSHSYPPLTYAVTTDPITGIRDGVLKRPASDPLVFHVDHSNEFWNMNASLNVHDGHGEPVPLPDDVRYYLAASHPHLGASGVAATPTQTRACRYPVNTGRSDSTLLRALLVALDEWADQGIEPPPNRFPSLGEETLVTFDEAARTFPAISGVTFPAALNGLPALDFGPTFGPDGGRMSQHPPDKGPAYRVLLPKVDADGHELGGVRTVDIAAPVGTNTGWNLYRTGLRADNLCGVNGSFFPFAETEAERRASGDPRLSLEERYTNHAGFVSAVREASRQLVEERFLLEEDAEILIEAAGASDILR